MEASRLNRVSPWEIEPSGSSSTTNSLMATSLKRTKTGLPSSKLEFPVPSMSQFFFFFWFTFEFSTSCNETSLMNCSIPLTGRIGTSDFGESLRFQKVLQGQEILGVDTTFNSINAHSHHQLSELRRCYPGSTYPGIASTGNNIRIPQMNSDVSCNGFGESFRFQKVLQGQEILPSQPYGQAFSVDEACRNGRFGLFDGHHQVPRSTNGWSSQTSNNSHFHPSVLMYQQASNMDYNSKINPVMEDNVLQRGSYYASEMKDGTFASTPTNKPIFRGLAHEDTNSFGTHSRDLVTLQRSSQELVSTCKNSCRVFGFSLTEGAPIANKDDEPSAVTCQINPGPPSFTRHIEDDFNPRHSVRSKAVESYCTKVSNIHPVRDMIIDRVF